MFNHCKAGLITLQCYEKIMDGLTMRFESVLLNEWIQQLHEEGGKCLFSQKKSDFTGKVEVFHFLVQFRDIMKN